MTGETRSGRPSLQQWREVFSKIDGVPPYPGPVPLSSENQGIAVGREGDRDQFLDRLRNHQLFVLHADSGVGKSSFLDAVLIPALNEEFVVFRIAEWSNLEDFPSSIDLMIMEKLKSERVNQDETTRWGKAVKRLRSATAIPTDGPRPLGQFLESYYDAGSGIVLVLDQFEELIRDSSVLFEQVGQWVDHMIRHHSIKIIVSLRSEYLHKVKNLGLGSGKAQLVLETTLWPITEPAYIKAIVEGGSADKRAGVTITDDAARTILESWQEATTATDRERPGLLQLHAVLYVLAHRAREAKSRVVDETLVKKLLKRYGDAVFFRSMNEAVWRKLQNCEAAAKDIGLDAVFRIGTKSAMERCVGHLSSGGYKLVLRDVDLFSRGFQRELRVHGAQYAGTDLEPRFKGAVQRLRPEAGLSLVPGSGPTPGAGAFEPKDLDEAEPWVGGPKPWVVDADDVSAGAALGLSRDFVLDEEIRRFLFGLEWLQEARLVRTVTPQAGQTMVALIHDGFSRPLERWAQGTQATFEQAAHQLTTIRGENFDWSESPVEDAVLVNLRWRDCQITATWRRVTFVNCDFRGSTFDKCEFEGVTFLNCMLDEASIRDATVVGDAEKSAVGEAESEEIEFSPFEPPSFFIAEKRDKSDRGKTAFDQAFGEALRSLRSYRGGDSSDGEGKGLSGLFSDTSGLPAVPLSRDDLDEQSEERIKPWSHRDGGIAFFGGRVYSLMLERCDFVSDENGESGSIAFFAISGSSLDIVDPAQAHVVIRSSAIRGLSVTVNNEKRKGDGTANIDLKVQDALLAATWFGDQLRGEVTFETCSLWQLWNNSDDELRVKVHNSAHLGLVNVSEVDADSIVLGRGRVFQIDEVTGTATLKTTSGSTELDPRRIELTDSIGSSMVDGANRVEYQAEPGKAELMRRISGRRGRSG